MKKHIVMAMFGTALFASSCERPIDFKGDGPSPRLVIDAVVGPNRGKPSISISEPDFEENTHLIGVEEAVFLFGGRKPAPVEDPTLKVSINGTDIPVEIATDWNSGKIYRHFHSPLAEGDRLEFSAETPLHGRVTASDIVPAPADITDLKSEWFTDPADNQSCLRTLVTVADRAGEKNYYRFAIRTTVRFRYTDYEYIQDPDTGEYIPTPVVREDEYSEEHEVMTDHEILFNRMDSSPASSERWGQVSDEVFDGRSYTFDLYIRLSREVWMQYEVISRSVTVDVHTLSPTTFKHLRSLNLYAGSDNLSEPVQIYSNVAGGYGIFGTYNVASKTAEIPPAS